MLHSYTIVIEEGQDGYLVASVVELPGCRTQAPDYQTLLERMQEAISLYKSEAKEYCPETKFVGIQQLSLSV